LYGMPSTKIDGMDVLTVRDSAREAIDKIRKNNGPILIEAMTYRFRGHSMADPSVYRENEEVQQWQKEKDPIELFKQYCISNDLLNESDFKSVDNEVKEIIQECLNFADNSPLPDMSVAMDKIYNTN
jgi:pyruvate dehydrogenase E1 component alpha subunit